MIKEWRKNDTSDLKSMVMLEQKTLTHLLTEKKSDNMDEINASIDLNSSNVLVEKIMSEKINKKYSNFSKSQRDIIQNYAIYSKNEKDHDKLRKFLSEKRNEAIKSLSVFEKTNDNKYIAEKMTLVENKIRNLDVAELNDSTITKFLTLTSLIEEIKTGEGE